MVQHLPVVQHQQKVSPKVAPVSSKEIEGKAPGDNVFIQGQQKSDQQRAKEYLDQVLGRVKQRLNGQ